MSGEFKMEGLDALLNTLNALPKQMQKNALERAGKRALQPFLAVVKDIAPTDSPSDSPDRPAYAYRDSFIISTKLNERQAKIKRKAGNTRAEVYAGTNDPVGTWLEFGFMHKRGDTLTWVPPQPHVSVAWNTTAGDVLGECAIALAEELDAALMRVVRRQ
ncbi:Bacteriophage HK97-gp10, putative tail-component [Sphingobium sp. AP50]|uniref:HK97 gp10 family phage protein n=1 Tax=Sphingobium sp. AP50 TaxID=1884369 RepID=UPI0008CA6E46|nr:HK97 gp10 family phage protein [Sphingobium sp. AP50]SEI68298.1 Bacteriophage HK97-gp10, putative tail-component [Sphingobium sp. AP50]